MSTAKVEFDVSFSHSDELGGELTSLIQETRAHFLVHDVLVDLPGRDRIRDFLAYSSGGGGSFLVYESDNLDTPVEDMSSQAALSGAPSIAHPEITLTFPLTAGAVYVRLPDPAAGNVQLESVTRSDGKSLLKENFWISSEREEHQWHAYVNIFDLNSTGSYTVRYQATGNDTTPPVSHLMIEEPSFSENPAYVNRATKFLFLAEDDLSGVDEILFQIDEGTFGPAINPFMFSQRPAYGDGPHTISFYSKDKAGNEEYPPLSVNIYLDTQPPVIDAFSVSPGLIIPDAPSGTGGGVGGANHSLAIDYRLSDATGQVTATVQVLTGDPASPAVVWENQETLPSDTASHLTWDGTSGTGSEKALVPPGSYTVQLVATDPLGQPVVSEAIPIEVTTYFNEQALSPCESCEQMYPDITQNLVVWQDNRNGNWDIYLYDLTTQSVQNLTPQSGDQTHPAIDGDRIVWQDSRGGSGDIYLFDRSTGQEMVIEDDGSSSQTMPAISGDWVVWQDNRYGNWDIYACNLLTKEKRRLTEDSADQINPSISDQTISGSSHGQMVVWEDYRHGMPEIYAYNLATGEESRLTSDSFNQTNPVVSKGKAAWVDQRSGTRQIFLHDLAAQTGSQITQGTSGCAQVALEGGKSYLIYTDYAQGTDDPNPMLSILNTSYSLLLTRNPAPQEEPDISGNKAVWQDYRSGRWQIYLTDVSAYFPDADHDGVVDDLDNCPDTPAGIAVDGQGCPDYLADTDGDGFSDGDEIDEGTNPKDPASVPDQSLAIYYGWPSLVNQCTSTDISCAVSAFSKFRVLILGDGLEHPDHGDHGPTKAIIFALHALPERKTIYGYIDLGTTTSNLSVDAIIQYANEWQAMGADGIFFDDAGWDFQVDRARLNQAVEYAHSKGMKVILNAWNPDDVLSEAYHETYNPDSLPASVLPGDGYLSESFRVSNGAYQDLEALAAKSDKCLAYRKKTGVKIYCAATGDDTGQDAFFCEKLTAFWQSFTQYGFNYSQYTNPLYSAANGPDNELWANSLNYHEKDSCKLTLVELELFKAVIQGNNTATAQGGKAEPKAPGGKKETAQGNRILITWCTLSEIDTAGFNIWRSESEDGEYIKINPEIIEAKGGATLAAEYSYTDDTAKAKDRIRYYYKLEDIDTKGGSTFHGPVQVEVPSRMSR